MCASEVKITILVDNQACEGYDHLSAGAGGGDAGAGCGVSSWRRTVRAWGHHAAPRRLRAEHGLAFWIESDERHILFDTGQGKSLNHNAPALGVDLSRTDVLVLSHGHYDHTGGLPHVLRKAPRARVHCHPDLLLSRFSVKEGAARSIGIPPRSLRAFAEVPPEQIDWVTEPVLLTETIGVTGPVPRYTGYEDTGGPFFLDEAGRRPDLIEDDLALWIRTREGIVVCLGCAHAGVVNTLDHLRMLTDGARVRAVIGGFHLINAGPDRLQKTIAALRALDIPLIVPCHCTGKDAFTMLADALGSRVSHGAGGMTFRF